MKKLKKVLVIAGFIFVGATIISASINIIKKKKKEKDVTHLPLKKTLNDGNNWELKGTDDPEYQELSKALTSDIEDNDILSSHNSDFKYDTNMEG